MIIIPVDLLFFQDPTQSTQTCFSHITYFQVIMDLHFDPARKEHQIPFPESCFGKSCAGFREKKKKIRGGGWMLRALSVKGHSEIT